MGASIFDLLTLQNSRFLLLERTIFWADISMHDGPGLEAALQSIIFSYFSLVGYLQANRSKPRRFENNLHEDSHAPEIKNA